VIPVKGELRRKILMIRDRMPASLRSQKDMRIRETLFSLPEFLSAQTIILYASFRSEVATYGLIQESISMGKKLFLPKVDAYNARLDLYVIRDIGELSPGFMGIPEPNLADFRIGNINDADIVIVPGVAFDVVGSRLGYGMGYYDKLLSMRKKLSPVVALAYDEQLVKEIPADEHDVRVDIIITDRQLIRVA